MPKSLLHFNTSGYKYILTFAVDILLRILQNLLILSAAQDNGIHSSVIQACIHVTNKSEVSVSKVCCQFFHKLKKKQFDCRISKIQS